jgi:hypothetical protein
MERSILYLSLLECRPPFSVHFPLESSVVCILWSFSPHGRKEGSFFLQVWRWHSSSGEEDWQFSPITSNPQAIPPPRFHSWSAIPFGFVFHFFEFEVGFFKTLKP